MRKRDEEKGRRMNGEEKIDKEYKRGKEGAKRSKEKPKVILKTKEKIKEKVKN